MAGMGARERWIYAIVLVDAINESGTRGLDVHDLGRVIGPLRQAGGRADTERALKVCTYRWMDALECSGVFEYEDQRKPRRLRRIRRDPKSWGDLTIPSTDARRLASLACSRPV